MVFQISPANPGFSITFYVGGRSFAVGGEVACENIRFSSLFATWDVSRGEKSATQRQKFHTDDVKSDGIRSEALISRRSSYIVLAIVYE